MNVLDKCLLNNEKQFQFTMKKLDKCLLNTPETIPIYYEGSW